VEAADHQAARLVPAVAGDPSSRIGDIRNMQLVFRQGVGYDPAKLIESVRGKVGLF